MKSGKTVYAWAFEGQWNDASLIKSNTFPMEWPPRSGKYIEVPEADRAAWFTFDSALTHIHDSQIAFLQRLAALKLS